MEFEQGVKLSAYEDIKEMAGLAGLTGARAGWAGWPPHTGAQCEETQTGSNLDPLTLGPQCEETTLEASLLWKLGLSRGSPHWGPSVGKPKLQGLGFPVGSPQRWGPSV